jgi:SET domain-containing protein 6
MGSRILSRSFQVESCEDKHDSPSAQGEEDTVDLTLIDVDQDEVPEGNHITDANSVEEDYDDDDEDTSGISMVPMADLLNARYGCNNVRASEFIHPVPLSNNRDRQDYSTTTRPFSVWRL